MFSEIETVAQELEGSGSKTKGYIQLSANRPLTLVLVQEEPLKLLRFALKYTPTTVLYFDATGGMVYTAKNKQDEVYYYAGVINLSTVHKSVAVCEALLQKNDSRGINLFVNEFVTWYVNL